jgi:hypothetical protein
MFDSFPPNCKISEAFSPQRAPGPNDPAVAINILIYILKFKTVSLRKKDKKKYILSFILKLQFTSHGKS